MPFAIFKSFSACRLRSRSLICVLLAEFEPWSVKELILYIERRGYVRIIQATGQLSWMQA
jgi:hypothetical protein